MSAKIILLKSLTGIGIGAALLAGLAQTSRLLPLPADSAGFAEGQSEPIIEVADVEWDFKNMRRGEVGQARFEIRNIGKSRLVLQKINGGCECVSSAQAPIIIPPLGHHTILATLDTNTMQGPVRRAIHYQTNSPARPKLSLYCRANVAKEDAFPVRLGRSIPRKPIAAGIVSEQVWGATKNVRLQKIRAIRKREHKTNV